VRANDFFGPFLTAGAGPDDVITYGPVDGRSPRMAVFRPAPSDTPAPVILHIHGGGWADGNEVSDRAFCRYLAGKGFLVFSATYTLATPSNPTWDIAPREVACAMATATAKSEEYGGSAHRFYVTGSSAGGNLAALVANRVSRGDSLDVECGAMPAITAVAMNIPAFDPGLAESNHYAIAGALSRRIAETYTGGTLAAVPDRYEATSASKFLHAGVPPTLIVYGPNDWLVPRETTLVYVERARALGVDVRAVAVPWTGHLIGLSGAGGRAISELTVDWFNTHRGVSIPAAGTVRAE
jgi:acetyl esterase/lipase